MNWIPSAEKRKRPVSCRKVRREWILCAVLAGSAVLLLFSSAQAGNDAGDREVLRGITSLGVEVEDLPRMAQKLGIKKDDLKTDVAGRLRQAGIAVVSDDVLRSNPPLPFLKVSLIIGYNKPAYMYAVMVGLNEKVALQRDPRIISYAMPWWRIVRGEQTGEGAVAGYVQETLSYIINEFIADHAAANAPPVQPEREKSQMGMDGQAYESIGNKENASDK